jgi:hypothetical protein
MDILHRTHADFHNSFLITEQSEKVEFEAPSVVTSI